VGGGGGGDGTLLVLLGEAVKDKVSVEGVAELLGGFTTSEVIA